MENQMNDMWDWIVALALAIACILVLWFIGSAIWKAIEVTLRWITK
jgi:F0F1-type ATP synthase membrane subunit b/b'